MKSKIIQIGRKIYFKVKDMSLFFGQPVIAREISQHNATLIKGVPEGSKLLLKNSPTQMASSFFVLNPLKLFQRVSQTIIKCIKTIHFFLNIEEIMDQRLKIIKNHLITLKCLIEIVCLLFFIIICVLVLIFICQLVLINIGKLIVKQLQLILNQQEKKRKNSIYVNILYLI